MICQEDRARRASKVQGPDIQEKQVLETLIISELGLGGPGMKMSRCWSRWGLVSYFSNLGLILHHKGVTESQILSLGPGLGQIPTHKLLSIHSSLTQVFTQQTFTGHLLLTFLSPQPKEHPAFSAPAFSPGYTATIK